MTPPRYPLLSLELVEGALRLAAARHIVVSPEFVGAYRDVNGEGDKLSEAWMRRRSLAIQQELTRVAPRWQLTTWSPIRSRPRGDRRRPGPTPMHLRLAAWGFSPEPQALEVFLAGAMRPSASPRAMV